MKTIREAEREAAEAVNRNVELIAWLNAESDRLDDHAAQDELDGEGLEVSTEGMELLRRRAKLLSLAAEILETGDPALGDGAKAVGEQLDRLAETDRANQAKLRWAGSELAALAKAAVDRDTPTPRPWPDDVALAVPAGDRRVKLGFLGAPPSVPVRVLSEANYQHALRCVNAMARLPETLDGLAAYSAAESQQDDDPEEQARHEGESSAYSEAAELVRQAREGR